MYARYYDCDPIMTKKVSSADQVCALKRNATSRQAVTFVEVSSPFYDTQSKNNNSLRTRPCGFVISVSQPAAVETLSFVRSQAVN